MDPFEVLKNLREYVDTRERYSNEGVDADDWITLCDNFAESFSALDEWMSKGGFSPWYQNTGKE